MKTYVITVSKFFPGFHPRKGEETGFVEKILSGEKIHTIRGNLELWQKRIAEVQEGKAVLSLRYWSGKPYRSPQVEFKQLTSADGVGIQDLKFLDGKPYTPFVEYRVQDMVELPAKDGLAYDDFESWFSNKQYNLLEAFAIIHFTNYRYLGA
ncbi:MAG TPA: hypothetical protein PLC89_12680 [Haliscomenobacter sp.]|uniref:hypothetical protein n=1 Tax=Haliscomenobacter sp. TaxID=2717303 RepID=UPI002BD53083|nr:hypothetical protein [Haliscomenobacter sp.]HOY18152.1 hypothetical protein [Haliscomenobacter sp.]